MISSLDLTAIRFSDKGRMKGGVGFIVLSLAFPFSGEGPEVGTAEAKVQSGEIL